MKKTITATEVSIKENWRVRKHIRRLERMQKNGHNTEFKKTYKKSWRGAFFKGGDHDNNRSDG